MSGVFKNLGNFGGDALKSMKNLAKDFRGSIKSLRTLSRQGRQIGKLDNAIASSTTGLADAERTSQKVSQLEGENLAKNSGQVKSDASEFRGLNDVGKTARAEQQIVSKGISKTTMFLGVSGVVLVSLGLASMSETDNALIDITDIEYYNSQNLKVTFNVANGSGGPNFALRPGNTISFEGARIATLTHPSLGDDDKQVTRILDDHSFLIHIDNLPDLLGTVHGTLSSTPSPSGSGGVAVSGPASPRGSSYWGQARVHSDFMSQFTGATGDGLALIAGAASDIIAAATPGVASALGNAAGLAGDTLDAMLHALTPAGLNALDTLSGAGKHAFCEIFPIACNSTLWWVLGGICIFIVIVMIAMKLKR